MEDWAETRAREWLAGRGGHWSRQSIASLAVLLREVDNNAAHKTLADMVPVRDEDWARCRAETLTEVRRVITASVDDLRHNAGLSPADMLNWNHKAAGAIWVRDEILARLEKL